MVSWLSVRDTTSLPQRIIADLRGSGPTALDAAAFAYLHVLLHAEDDLRIEVARRVNLIHWEHRVHEEVRAAFVSYRPTQ
jgi:metaxin